MGLLDIFKGSRVDLASISFKKTVAIRSDDLPFAHASTISNHIQTRKKNYYKLIFDGYETSDMALYVAPEYIGTKSTKLQTTVDRMAGFNRRTDYPLYLQVDKFDKTKVSFTTDLGLIQANCRDIHMELDEKEGVLCTKHIVHCADNEDDYDMYLVFYEADLPRKVIDELLIPAWRL